MDELETKYNYVFYYCNYEYDEAIMEPLKKYSFVRVYKRAFDANPIIQKIFFYHFSAKLNSIIKLPFKGIWHKKICIQDFDNNKPTCYFFTTGKYITEDHSLYDYIKKLNPKNKVVIYCGDLIEKKPWTVESIRDYCDYILTYDKGEAEKYGITYCTNAFGYYPIIEQIKTDNFKTDIYFIGYAKDRLEQLHNIYNFLTKNGVRCKFIICGVDEDDKIDGDGLYYQEPISYIENLQNVNNSKCILDVVQGKCDGISLRIKEAIVYKRKYITNNVNVKLLPYYNQDNMSCFETLDDIDIKFIRKEINYSSFDDNLFNPNKIIYYLENLLKE